MNKTVRKIVSLVVAMTFVIAMAVPTVFAATIAPTTNEAWEINLYKDLECTIPITDLEPDQTAYAQVSATGLRYFGGANFNIIPTNLEIIRIIDRVADNSALDFDVMVNANGILPEAALTELEIDNTAPTLYNNVIDGKAVIIIGGKAGATFEISGNNVFTLTGADVDTPSTLPLNLVTLEVKAPSNYNGGAKLDLEYPDTVRFQIGESQGAGIMTSPKGTEVAGQALTAGLPAVDTTKPIDVVQGDPADTENPPAVVKDGNIPPVSETDADKLFGEGSNYYFRVTYTSGTYGYFKITNTKKPGDTSTVTTPTAYIGANSFDLGEENTKDFSITQADFVYPKYSIDTTDTTVSLTVSVQGALYRFKADASITIPRGDTSITLPNADFVKLLEKSIDGGTTWNATIEDDEINSGEGVTLTVAKNMGNEGTSIADTAVTISPEVTLTGKTTLTLVVGKAESKGNYRVKADQDPFTLYVSNKTFNKDIALEEQFTDRWHDAGTTADLPGATITIADWDTIQGKETDPAGVVKTATVTWTEGETPKTATGNVTIIIKAAEPVEDSYRVAKVDNANQSFDLPYNTDFGKGQPEVAFEQEMKVSETEFTWEACKLPEGYTYELGDEYEINKPGTYTVTVTLKNADGKEIPMTQNTITVVVAEMLYDEYQVSLADGVDAYELTYKTPVSAIDTTKLVVKQAKIANGNTDKTFEPITADASLIKFMSGNADLSVDAAYITEDLTSVSVLYNGIAAGSIDVAVNKTVTSYDVAWYNNVTTLTVPEDITAAELADLVVVTANYGAVKEVIDADVTIEGLAEVTATGTVKVFVDGVDTGKTLSITKDAAATKWVTVSIPVIGVSASGLGTTIIGEDAVAVAGGSNVKVFAEVTGIDGVYTLNIPGFSPVDVTVAEDGTVTIPEDAALYAGWVAVETGATVKTTIDDTDFYAIAANLNGDAVANAKYDLNKDGKIDALDIDVMLSNLGATIIAE